MSTPQQRISTVAILGGGSAGFMAALTLKRKLPDLQVTVIRSPDIGVIGVGEGTTAAFPKHFFDYLKLKPQQFYNEAEPTWKLGIHFLWGPSKGFYYTFAYEFEKRQPDLSRNNGFFFDPESPWCGPVSAFMAKDKAFPRRPDGLLQIHNNHAFHIENQKLVAWLENRARDFGVRVIDATVRAETGPEGIAALVGQDQTRYTADLYVDASGFRSELLGGALGEPVLSYTDALFCDRAVIGGWSRTTEPIRPYTVAETMDCGWCWQIEHENWINRGYVYSSGAISDEAALQEFLQKNPKVSNTPRVVRFRSGRHQRLWVKNVVAVGNSAGFVEPLEATALQVICVEASTLADSLIDSECAPSPTLIELYNRYNTQAWDDIRDFLAIHYKFNTRLNTPFWQACRNDTQLHGAEFLVQFYRENGPSVVAGAQLLHPSNSFGMDGYLALLVGQQVPHEKPHSPSPSELALWKSRRTGWEQMAQAGLNVRQCLDMIRKPGWRWA
jgi:tryptophan halogenase